MLAPERKEASIPNADDGSLAWVAENIEHLRNRYGLGTWVLVKAKEIVGAGADLGAVLRDADVRKIEGPLIIRIEAPSPARRSAFAAWLTSRSS